MVRQAFCSDCVHLWLTTRKLINNIKRHLAKRFSLFGPGQEQLCSMMSNFFTLPAQDGPNIWPEELSDNSGETAIWG